MAAATTKISTLFLSSSVVKYKSSYNTRSNHYVPTFQQQCSSMAVKGLSLSSQCSSMGSGFGPSLSFSSSFPVDKVSNRGLTVPFAKTGDRTGESSIGGIWGKILGLSVPVDDWTVVWQEILSLMKKTLSSGIFASLRAVLLLLLSVATLVAAGPFAIVLGAVSLFGEKGLYFASGLGGVVTTSFKEIVENLCGLHYINSFGVGDMIYDSGIEDEEIVILRVVESGYTKVELITEILSSMKKTTYTCIFASLREVLLLLWCTGTLVAAGLFAFALGAVSLLCGMLYGKKGLRIASGLGGVVTTPLKEIAENVVCGVRGSFIRVNDTIKVEGTNLLGQVVKRGYTEFELLTKEKKTVPVPYSLLQGAKIKIIRVFPPSHSDIWEMQC